MNSRPLWKRNRPSDTLASVVTQTASAIDKACSSNPFKVGADKILTDLFEGDGLDESRLLGAYDILTENERKYELFSYLPINLRTRWYFDKLRALTFET